MGNTGNKHLMEQIKLRQNDKCLITSSRILSIR